MGLYEFNDLPKKEDLFGKDTKELNNLKRKLRREQKKLDEMDFAYNSRDHFRLIKINCLIQDISKETASRKGVPHFKAVA